MPNVYIEPRPKARERFQLPVSRAKCSAVALSRARGSRRPPRGRSLFRGKLSQWSSTAYHNSY